MSLLNEQRVLAASIEGTSGTAETLDATDATFNVYTDGPIIECTTGFTQRDGQSSFDSLPGVIQGKQGRARFSTDLVGASSGVSPAWALTFLPGCGMVESSRSWTFVTGASAAKTLTLAEYIDGSYRILYGAVGTFTIDLTAGQAGRVNFEFLGVYGTETDATILAPTYETVKPPRWANASGCAYNSQNLVLNTLQIAANNELKLRESANVTAGYVGGIITNRRVTWNADPEAVVLSTVNWMSVYEASTEASLAAVVGTTTHNIITITMPKAQLVEPPNVGDRDGLSTRLLSGQANRNAAAGDDCLSLVFS
jgi:hypothetical protein